MKNLKHLFPWVILTILGVMTLHGSGLEAPEARHMFFLYDSFDTEARAECTGFVAEGTELFFNVPDSTREGYVEEVVAAYKSSGDFVGAVDLGRLLYEVGPGTHVIRTRSYGRVDLPMVRNAEYRICTKSVKRPLAKASGGTISGTVTKSSDGLPVTDGWVSIYDDVGSLLGLAFLDDSGGYSYGGLESGTYYARTDSTGLFDELWDDIPCAQDNCVVTSGTPISVGSSTVSADFVLDTGGTVSGTVTASADGLPVTDGWVSIYDDVGSLLGLAFLDDAGGYSYGGLESGTYYARTDSTGLFDELWDDIPCAQDNCVVTSGTPISVGSSTVSADFVLDTGGTVSGTVTASADGLPVTDGWVSIYDDVGSLLGLAFLDDSGGYSYGGLESGTYYARTDSTGLFDELWDDIPCADGSCVVTSGTPISVSTGSTTANFSLAPGGAIDGTVISSESGAPITEGWVSVYDAAGSLLGLAFLDDVGAYSYGGLEPATYYARTDSTGYFDELWNDLPCPQDNCIVTSGTPITVDAEPVVADFALDPGGTITGTVTNGATGLPVVEGWVSIYDSGGALLGLAFLDDAGGYSYGGLEPGTYYARTDSTGLFDELWDDIPCAQDNCIVTSGTPIEVSANTVSADFVLGEAEENVLFSDGFESGDTSAWAFVLGN